MIPLKTMTAATLLSILALTDATPAASQQQAEVQQNQSLYEQGVQSADQGLSLEFRQPLTADSYFIKAEAAFQTVIRSQPDWPDPYYSLAIVQTKLGRLNEAANSYRIYLTLRPDDPNAVKIWETMRNLKQRAPYSVNRDMIIDMLTSIRTEGAWDLYRTGGGIGAPYLHFERSGNQLYYVEEINRNIPLRISIPIPERGVEIFSFTTRQKNTVNVPPCPCDMIKNITIRIISKDEFSMTIHSYSKNWYLNWNEVDKYRFRRNQ